MGRHAKRTTVTRTPEGWRVDFASLDQPSGATLPSHAHAIDVAVRFEHIRARARYIEARRLVPSDPTTAPPNEPGSMAEKVAELSVRADAILARLQRMVNGQRVV